jgi:hypothetical protein
MVDALVNAIQRLRDTDALSRRPSGWVGPMSAFIGRTNGPRTASRLHPRIVL